MNAVVLGGFAALALAISIVGVSGVLIDGVTIAAIGVAAGGLVGWGLSRLAGNCVAELKLPGPLPLLASAAVIFAAAAMASLVPRESTPFKRFALNETAAPPLPVSLPFPTAKARASGRDHTSVRPGTLPGSKSCAGPDQHFSEY